MKYKLVAVALNEDGTCEQLCICKNASEEQIIKFQNEIKNNKQKELKEKEEIKQEILKLRGEIGFLRQDIKLLKGE